MYDFVPLNTSGGGVPCTIAIPQASADCWVEDVGELRKENKWGFEEELAKENRELESPILSEEYCGRPQLYSSVRGVKS